MKVIRKFVYIFDLQTEMSINQNKRKESGDGEISRKEQGGKPVL